MCSGIGKEYHSLFPSILLTLVFFLSVIQHNHMWGTPYLLALLNLSCFQKLHRLFSFPRCPSWDYRGSMNTKAQGSPEAELICSTSNWLLETDQFFVLLILTISRFPLKCRRLENGKSYSVSVSYLYFYAFQDEVITCINKPPELFLVCSAGLHASWGFLSTLLFCLPWGPWQVQAKCA